jgi:hypothetical protein
VSLGKGILELVLLSLYLVFLCQIDYDYFLGGFLFNTNEKSFTAGGHNILVLVRTPSSWKAIVSVCGIRRMRERGVEKKGG